LPFHLREQVAVLLSNRKPRVLIVSIGGVFEEGIVFIALLLLPFVGIFLALDERPVTRDSFCFWDR
jgi:hypothetical protein